MREPVARDLRCKKFSAGKPPVFHRLDLNRHGHHVGLCGGPVRHGQHTLNEALCTFVGYAPTFTLLFY